MTSDPIYRAYRAHLTHLDKQMLAGSATTKTHPPRIRRVDAERYAALGEEWLRRFQVTLITTKHKGLSGFALSNRMIKTPWPTSTPSRLYILAHEIGHVVLEHNPFCPMSRLKFESELKPEYVREFEAELFAHSLLRTEGVTVPVTMTDDAKLNVRMYLKLDEQVLGGFDPAIVNWVNPALYFFLKSTRPNVFHPEDKRYFAVAKQRVRAVLALKGGVS